MALLAPVEFDFVPPPEAPVFRPTPEEFADPLAYINKIRPVAEQTGICRIVPPQDWQPPFAVDIDNLKFTPRIQRLNELEAHTRVKLNFLDQIAKFWELQGSSLKIPLVEAQALDLYTLHREVNRQGGLVAVTSSRLWGKIAQRMGFPGAKNQLGMTLKQHYERVLLPFDIFQAEKAAQNEPQASTSGESGAKAEPLKSETADSAAVEETGPAVRRPSRLQQQPSLDHDTVTEVAEQAGGHSKELKRLQFYGAGPKMSGYQEGAKAKPRPKKEHYELDPLARYVCHCCARGDSEEAMLLCDGCDDSYHTFCLNPPLAEIPKGDWRCPRCVATEVDKPQEPFGFEQAQKQYTLHTFGEMADQFKSDYFNMPVHLVPCEAVEREYWRIVSTIDEDVIVEYGADLHTMDHGSGFPTRDSKDLSADDEQYVTSGWNLNNIAVQDNSILAHIKANISGMKVPWMYVGMCFSTFCWHTEDHWSYSINYLHWGEPKTWYGCSGRRADQFEDAMRSSAPDLFRVQPDLLHQLVTTMNPNILMAAGVPIFRTDQQAGDFVVTFPRAYHSGFNHGFNLAEAVNFTPPDWMAMGRECVQHYSNLRRFCVFSHDELACTMALQPDRLSLLVASATYQDLLKLIDLERHARARLLEKGVRKAEREAFELLPDDERQCDFCKTTCFLSALTCPCNKKLVCLRHQDKLCGCLPSNHILRFRYTLHELPEMLRRLRERVESFDQWILKVKNGLVATGDARLGIEDLKSLLQEAQAKRFPESDLIKSLALVIEEANKCSTVAQQLTGQKVRTRTRQQCESRFRLSVDELQLFYEHVTQLACRIPDENKLKQLVDQVMEFQRRAVRLMEPEMPPPSAEVQACVDRGTEIDIALPELVELKQRLSHSLWLEEVDAGLTGQRRLQLNDVVRLVESGMTLPPYRVVERAMAELQTLLLTGQQHEQHAKQALDDSPWRSMAELERLVKAADKLPVQLPSVDAVREVVSKAADWIEKVSAFGDKDKPQLELVEAMLSRGRALPVELLDLGRMEALVVAASAWKDRAERVFFRRNLYLTLLEILSPRADTRIYQTRRRRRRLKEDSSTASGGSTGGLLTSGSSMAQLVQLYNEAETRELELMRELRATHRRKRDTESDTGSFCLCRRPTQGYMLQCELCWDLFHLSCVPPGAKLAINRTRPTASELQFTKFLCPLCTRSRRPRLDAVLGLLVGLQKIAVRLPEGVALHCLTERAMRWQDRARSLLSSDQLSAALVRLANSSHCPQGVAADKTTAKVVADASSDDVAAGSEDSPRPPSTSMSDDEDPATGFSATEHTYSFGGSRDSQQPATSSARKPRKSLLAPRQGVSPPPPAPLGSAVPARPLLAADWVGRLEDLMLEADLLEVTSDEAADLWRLIASARPPVKHDYFSEGDKTVPERPARSKLPGSLRKRRSQAGVPGSSGAAAAAVLKRLKVKVKPDQRRDELTPSSQSESSPGSSPTKPRAKSLAAAFRRKAALKDRPRTGERAMKPRKHMDPSAGPAGSLEAAGDEGGGAEGHYSEDCAARPCQKPHGTCINWIGCDRCEQWYHYICVGLPRNYRVTEDMVYICPQCQDQPSPTAVPVQSQQDAAGCASGGGEGQLTTSVGQSGASLLDLAAAAAHLQQSGADTLGDEAGTLGDGSGSTQPLQQHDVFVKQEMDTAEPDSPPALVIADSSTEE